MVQSLATIGAGLLCEICGCIFVCKHKEGIAAVFAIVGVVIVFYALWTAPVSPVY